MAAWKGDSKKKGIERVSERLGVSEPFPFTGYAAYLTRIEFTPLPYHETDRMKAVNDANMDQSSVI